MYYTLTVNFVHVHWAEISLRSRTLSLLVFVRLSFSVAISYCPHQNVTLIIKEYCGLCLQTVSMTNGFVFGHVCVKRAIEASGGISL